MVNEIILSVNYTVHIAIKLDTLSVVNFVGSLFTFIKSLSWNNVTIV